MVFAQLLKTYNTLSQQRALSYYAHLFDGVEKEARESKCQSNLLAFGLR